MKKIKFLGFLALSTLVITSCDKFKKGGDFVDEISTEASTITVDHAGYDEQITHALTPGNGVDYYVEGTIEYQLNGNTVATVDFGDGTSDDVATAEYDGAVNSVDLYKEDCYYDGKKSEYKKVIVKPIVKSRDCDYIISGIIKYYNAESGAWEATVDFGDGTCDDIAVKTTAEGNYTFTVSQYYK